VSTDVALRALGFVRTKAMNLKEGEGHITVACRENRGATSKLRHENGWSLGDGEWWMCGWWYGLMDVLPVSINLQDGDATKESKLM
jgi:hypothetical protein